MGKISKAGEAKRGEDGCPTAALLVGTADLGRRINR
jgi:hypothetical protein